MIKQKKIKIICIIDLLLLFFPLVLNVLRIIKFGMPVMSVVLIKYFLLILAIVIVLFMLYKQIFSKKTVSIIMLLLLISEAGNLIVSDDYGTVYVIVVVACIIFSLLAFIFSLFKSSIHYFTLVFYYIRTFLRIISAIVLVFSLGVESVLLFILTLIAYVALEIIFAIPHIYYIKCANDVSVCE